MQNTKWNMRIHPTNHNNTAVFHPIRDILFIDEVELTADSDRSYSTHSQDKYEYKMTHRTNTAQNAHLSWKLWEMPGSLMIKQGSPKPKGQLASTVGTGKGTAALLTCPLNELQFFA